MAAGIRLSAALEKKELDRLVEIVFHTSVYQARQIEGGLFNTSYELVVGGKRYILRLGPIDRSTLLPYEHHLMAAECFAYRQMRRAGIPCSEVVCCDTTKLLLNRDYMVVCAAEGEVLSKLELFPEEKDAVYTELGGYIAKLHQIREPMFGRLSSVLQGKGEFRWSKALLQMHHEWSSMAAPTGYFSESELCCTEQALLDRQELLDEITAPMLSHCDLWENNVLAKRENNRIVITAIIDIDRAVCGDPAFEFGYDFMLTDAFKRGYRSFKTDKASVMRRNIYRMLCSLNDAYVWYAEYQDVQCGDDCRRAAMTALQALDDIEQNMEK